MEVLGSKKSVDFELEKRSTISVLLPVYNEAEIISDIVKNYYNEICRKVSATLIVAEDGSADGTEEILASLQSELPIVLLSDPNRKGYARAVSDALKRCSSDWIFFSDSDGQYSPSDFWKLWKWRNDCDMVIGRRVHRSERAHRIVLAKGFHILLNGLLGLNLGDSDCGFRLIRKDVIRLIIDKLGFLDYSFWAEFTIRACFEGFRIREVPINHSNRIHGDTHIYKRSEIVMIVLRQLKGLVYVARDLNQKPCETN
jgi:glycosyltransferase involved in cell wall biosynthesis